MTNISELQARIYLKENLVKCNKSQQQFFRKMYANENSEILLCDMVDNIEAHKLDWAVAQVSTALRLMQNKGKENE